MKNDSPRSGSSFEALAQPIRAVLLELGLRTPTKPQALAIPKIIQGEHFLLVVPTASGKTEAALLPVFSRLVTNKKRKGRSILYVTFLRGLNRDMLTRVNRLSNKMGVRCEVRHGETPTSQRRRQLKDPPEMLITTPETLQAIPSSKEMRKHLKHVQAVIIDEIHELAENKRGAQLTLALERLRQIARRRFQRIDLSATIADPRKPGEFLVGPTAHCKIVRINVGRETEYHVEYPYPTPEDHDLAQSLYTGPEAAARISRIKEFVVAPSLALEDMNDREQLLTHMNSSLGMQT